MWRTICKDIIFLYLMMVATGIYFSLPRLHIAVKRLLLGLFVYENL